MLVDYYPHWDIPLHVMDILRTINFIYGSGAGLTYYVKQTILHRKMIWNADYYTRDCRNYFILQNVLPPILTQKMIIKVKRIAQRYDILGYSFGTKLKNAASNMFTFANHPNMEPTNNESERMLRKVVIHRK